MQARYDKVIVICDEDEAKRAVVIFDERIHLPVFWGLQKFGMDEVLELFGGNRNAGPETPKGEIVP